MKKTTSKATRKTTAKRVLTEEQRLKRNAYMRKYLKEWNKDPAHRKAKSEYQKARYQRIKAEKAKAAKKAAKVQATKVQTKKVAKHAVKAVVHTTVKAAPKKVVKIGKKGK